jgi:hypothetical protein
MTTLTNSPIQSATPTVAAASVRPRPTVEKAGFTQVLQSEQNTKVPERRVRIEQGDTLRGLIRANSAQPLTEQQLQRRVVVVAQANGLSDPNRIMAGEHLRLPSVSETTFAPVKSSPTGGPHVVLRQTLDRAVQKGYVKAAERGLVEHSIVSMSKRHGFSPDDFARVALMESDGLNPRATNGRCHGIIQFCEGAARGADSVGLRGRAHEIAQMSVPQQLKLVDRYLDDVGLSRQAAAASQTRGSHKVGLDDLYLAVLTPSASREKRPDAPLNIAGQQARALYVGADREQAITRASLSQGLQKHAQKVLNPVTLNSGKSFATERQQLAARNTYVEVAVLGQLAAKDGQQTP